MKNLQALTSNLQAESKDIIAAVQEMNNLTLQNTRENVTTQHSRWFSMVENMCTDIGTEPSIPRRCGHQRHRSNVPAETPSEYFRRTISIPLLDHLLSEMKLCFSSHQQTALLGLSVVPSVMASLSTEEYTTRVSELADMYQDDLPSPNCIVSESGR